MTKRIFVVDDEKVIADSLAAILNLSGFEASAFYDPEAALSACEIGKPEYIIIDVVMPGMSGVDLAIQIKERLPECRILLFSGQAATADILEKARKGGHDFDLLLKPVHPKDLLAKLGVGNSNPSQNAPVFASA